LVTSHQKQRKEVSMNYELLLQGGHLIDPRNNIDGPRDVAIYVGSGTLDVGITGRDMLIDSGAEADEVMPLGFAPSTFRLAAPAATATTLADLQGKRIATSYAGLLRGWLEREGIEAKVVSLDGAVGTPWPSAWPTRSPRRGHRTAPSG
jgi:ABC-type nitrate/sulfonate/bicarbonate transport system substrate-binding protein